MPNRNVNSIPTGAVFLGQNTFENELGGISLEVGRTGGGGTGVYFNNTSVSSGTAGELISKSKATALAIALG